MYLKKILTQYIVDVLVILFDVAGGGGRLQTKHHRIVF